MPSRMRRFTRRGWLQAAAALPLAASSQPAFPGKRPMLLHNDYPEDLEALPEYLATWITPVEQFFVRQHLPRPSIDPRAWRLEIGGMVPRRLSLSLEELKQLPQHTVPATLECAGNGRGNFRPRVPGLQWMKGAIGNAEWRGPRVRDLLARAGAASSAAYATFDGADVGVAQTPDFIRSIPMRKAMHEATIVALEMNGQPLPDLHGYPARLIVPGWDGASWVKWVSRVEVAEGPDAGFYMATAYRYPRNPVLPGGAARPEDMLVIEGMTVKSFFAKPADRAVLARGRTVSLTGAAWAGEQRVVRVEVSVDGGSKWQDAALSSQDFHFAWRIWSYEWKPDRPGYHALCCRATDSAGRTQPIEAVWNPAGYLWNAIERIGVMVEG